MSDGSDRRSPCSPSHDRILRIQSLGRRRRSIRRSRSCRYHRSIQAKRSAAGVGPSPEPSACRVAQTSPPSRGPRRRKPARRKARAGACVWCKIAGSASVFPSMKQRGHRDSTQGGRKKHIEAFMSEKEWVRVRERASPGHVLFFPLNRICYSYTQFSVSVLVRSKFIVSYLARRGIYRDLSSISLQLPVPGMSILFPVPYSYTVQTMYLAAPLCRLYT